MDIARHFCLMFRIFRKHSVIYLVASVICSLHRFSVYPWTTTPILLPGSLVMTMFVHHPFPFLTTSDICSSREDRMRSRVYNRSMNTILLLYLTLCVIHVSCRDLKLEMASRVTKILLMPVLLWYYLSLETAGDGLRLFVILALTFGTLGDLLLLFDDKPLCFALGGGSFLVGHIFYILAFARFFTSPVFTIIYVAICIYPMLKISKLLKQSPAPLPMFLYALVLLAVGAFASGAASWTALLGVVSFVLSDGMLGLNTIEKKYSSVPIMLTYTLAQLLLVIGLLHLQGAL